MGTAIRGWSGAAGWCPCPSAGWRCPLRRAETSPPHQALTPRPCPPFPGLLLHDVTMAGLQELRFPEEKPLLRGQDAAELVSSRPFAVLGAEGATSWLRRKLRAFSLVCLMASR